MEKIDLVMVVTEGVAESGGIINKVSGDTSLKSLPTCSHFYSSGGGGDAAWTVKR